MAARATEIHSTISNALPRVGQTIAFRGLSCLAKPLLTDDTKRSSVPPVLLKIAIGNLRVTIDVDRGEDADGLKTRGIRVERGHVDRKSTRLNSSHLGISYAVF